MRNAKRILALVAVLVLVFSQVAFAADANDKVPFSGPWTAKHSVNVLGVKMSASRMLIAKDATLSAGTFAAGITLNGITIPQKVRGTITETSAVKETRKAKTKTYYLEGTVRMTPTSEKLGNIFVRSFIEQLSNEVKYKYEITRSGTTDKPVSLTLYGTYMYNKVIPIDLAQKFVYTAPKISSMKYDTKLKSGKGDQTATFTVNASTDFVLIYGKADLSDEPMIAVKNPLTGKIAAPIKQDTKADGTTLIKSKKIYVCSGAFDAYDNPVPTWLQAKKTYTVKWK